MVVQDPISYDRDHLASNESVTFVCRDQNARPAPSLVWFIDGNMVNGMNSRYFISDGNRYTYCTNYSIFGTANVIFKFVKNATA